MLGLAYPTNATYPLIACEFFNTAWQTIRLTPSRFYAGVAVANLVSRIVPHTKIAACFAAPYHLAHKISEANRHAGGTAYTILPSAIIGLTTLGARSCYNFVAHPILKGAILGSHAAITSLFSLSADFLAKTCPKKASSDQLSAETKKASKTQEIHFVSQKDILFKIFSLPCGTNELSEANEKRVEIATQTLAGLVLIVSSIGLAKLRFHPITTNALAYSAAALTSAVVKAAFHI